MDRTAGREIYVVFVEHRLRPEPAFTPLTAKAVVVHDSDSMPSLCIDGEGLNKIVGIARDTNNALRDVAGLAHGLFVESFVSQRNALLHM